MKTLSASSIPDQVFRLLFEHASDAHLIFDENGIIDCNEGAVQVLGAASKADVLRMHPHELSPERQPDGLVSRDKSRQMNQMALERGFHRFTWYHQKLDGTVFPVEVTLNAIQMNGRPAWLAVWHDLTELKRKEEALERYKSRLEAQLDTANAVQRSLLPNKTPFLKGIRSSWLFEPSDELCGDTLNIFALDERHVGFYLMDASGHGVPAALLSVSAGYFLSPYSDHSFLRSDKGRRVADSPILCPHEVLERLNHQFSSHPDFNQLLTVVYGILDTETFELAYASAGHPPIALMSDKEFRFLESGGPPIGVAPGIAYPVEKVQLKSKDRVYLYSDGVTEARDSRGVLFGEQRLKKVLQSAQAQPLETSISQLFNAIQSCSPSGARIVDDVTVLGIEVT